MKISSSCEHRMKTTPVEIICLGWKRASTCRPYFTSLNHWSSVLSFKLSAYLVDAMDRNLVYVFPPFRFGIYSPAGDHHRDLQHHIYCSSMTKQSLYTCLFVLFCSTTLRFTLRQYILSQFKSRVSHVNQ